MSSKRVRMCEYTVCGGAPMLCFFKGLGWADEIFMAATEGLAAEAESGVDGGGGGERSTVPSEASHPSPLLLPPPLSLCIKRCAEERGTDERFRVSVST